MVPVVIAVTMAFCQGILAFPAHERAGFALGIMVYVFVHLFVFEPKGFYGLGHRLVAEIFRFFAPLVNVAPLVIPIYTILLLIFYYFATLFSRAHGNWSCVYMFLVSFTLTMHLVFTSKSLRESGGSAAKPNYLFSMTWVYAVNLFLIAMLLDLVMADFSFPRFFTSASQTAGWIYKVIFRQLF